MAYHYSIPPSVEVDGRTRIIVAYMLIVSSKIESPYATVLNQDKRYWGGFKPVGENCESGVSSPTQPTIYRRLETSPLVDEVFEIYCECSEPGWDGYDRLGAF